MTLILRVECPQGKGPYAPGRYSKSAFYAHEYGGCPLDYARHPDPSEDDLIAKDFSLVKISMHPHLSFVGTRFGFTSSKQYYTWFYTAKTRALLASMEYRISLYFVDDPQFVVEGETQALFDKQRAALHNKYPCDTPLEVLQDACIEAEQRFQPTD